MKLIMFIFLVVSINGCISLLPRCDIKELCHYSSFYHDAPQVQRLNFEKLNSKEQVTVFIYGVKYLYYRPYDVIDALKNRSPNILPILIDMVEQYEGPYVREFSMEICQSIMTRYPEVRNDSRVNQFIMDSQKIVLQEKAESDEIMKNYYLKKGVVVPK